ncbi:MAG: Ig-like domain-containing protein [Acidobacteriia bacterium]|nr:Ig-like domain-containing protein [Terriglobia bacterium]
MSKLGPIAVLLSVASLGFAQRPSTVSLSASASSLICGSQLQVSALVQDQSFNVISNPPLTWASSDKTIASVDSSGNVTALLPGIVSITATDSGVRGTLQLQTVPLRIDVTPANQTLTIGSRLQYTATVLDINQQPLSAPVTWQLAGANAFNTSEANLSPSGMLTTSAASNLTIRALISYNNYYPNFLPAFVGETTATVVPPADYTIRSLLTSNETRQSFQLLARRGGIAVNDSEQVALVASLDGLSDGVLLADHGSYQILASGGTPTLMPGGNLIDFEDPVINNSGTVVLRGDTYGSSGGLLSLSKTQFQYLLTDGTTSAYTDLEGIRVSRFALNNNGAVVFTATYLPTGSTSRAVGLFDMQRGLINLDVSSPGTVLPGLQASFTFDGYYGMDSQGNLYFSASDGHYRGVYQVAPDGTLSMALGTGNHLRGSIVRNIFGLGIGSSGDLAIGCDRPDGSQFVLRFANGDLSSAPEVLSLNWVGQIYTVNAAGVLFYGDAGQGAGLYLWPPKASTANPILLQGGPAPSGDPIVEIQAAAMTSAGTVFAKVRTASQPLELLRIAAGGVTMLLESGDQLAVTANLTLMGLVQGAAVGDPHPLMGGFQASVFQLNDSQGLIPRVLVGDRLSTAPFSGYQPARKALDGSLYVVPDDGIFRVGAGGNSLVFGLPHTDADGVVQNGLAGGSLGLSGGLAANQDGAVAWISNTNQNHQRLYLLSGGTLRLLAYIGGNSQYRTNSPAGGYFSNWQELALDNTGRVMARFSVTGGPSGYFLWANGQWTAAALFGQTTVAGQVVDGAGQMKASAANFYATFTAHGGPPTVLAQYTSGGWNQLAAAGLALPDGAELNSFTNLAVDRADEVAYSGWSSGGSPEIVVMTGTTARIALSGSQPLSDGSFVQNIQQIDFRDDHRVFFVAFDVYDRMNLYVAEPNF